MGKSNKSKRGDEKPIKKIVKPEPRLRINPNDYVPRNYNQRQGKISPSEDSSE